MNHRKKPPKDRPDDNAPARDIVKDILSRSEHRRLSVSDRRDTGRIMGSILENVVKPRIGQYPVDNFDFSEFGQTDAAVCYFWGLMKYCPEWGWLVYDTADGTYRADCGEMVLIETLKHMASRREKWPQTIRGVYNIAKSLETNPNIRCAPGDFDANPKLLNCKGKTANLKTGNTEQSLPEDLHTKSTGYGLPDIGTNKLPELFLNFLNEITCGDTDMAKWLLRWFGYCLTGDVSAGYFVNFYGNGGNGKGVLLRVMQKIMGSYAVTLSPRAVVLQGRETSGRFELADLRGARLAIIDDVPDGRFDEITIKQLTGEGRIRAEQKFKNSFEFTPIAKLALASNTRLGMRDTGNSMKRRLRAVPFNYTPTPDKTDPGLEEKLLEEAPYILALAIEQAKIYLDNPGPAGFPPCAAIDEASKEYIESQDTVAQFLEEKTEKAADGAEDAGISAKEVYNAYKDWCAANSHKPLTVTRFGENIKRNGITKTRKTKGNWYTGIALAKDTD